jgi:4-hydroxybenzoate polyprenyltransferase
VKSEGFLRSSLLLLSIRMHPYLRHLRTHFNLLLSPIYLWGVLLAGGTVASLRFWLGYITLHFFLYGGGTAFNSYYDRDEGPIGGMAEPPPVDRGLLWFSLVIQLVGLPLAIAVGAPFTVMWLIICVLMILYSHPLVRLKSNSVAALLAVAIGQGAVGFAAGWFAVRTEWNSLLEADALWGMLTTALIVTGLYIITQSYQTKEDSVRGDKTLPVLLGARNALLVSLLILGIGGGIMVQYLWGRFGAGWAVALGAFFALVGIAQLRWALSFDESKVMMNYRTSMRFASLSSGVLSLFLLYHLFF